MDTCVTIPNYPHPSRHSFCSASKVNYALRLCFVSYPFTSMCNTKGEKLVCLLVADKNLHIKPDDYSMM